jgi:chemotaxis protein methyltransferase CheR
MRDSEFEFIRSLVYERSRIHLGNEKRELVLARLNKRLRANHMESISDYCRFLQEPESAKAELPHLIDVISTHHTAFFRENQHFEFVREKAVPEFCERARKERWVKLRVWSAACSSGEEPYTLAIVLTESFRGMSWSWQLDATDISEGTLAKARAGIYPAETVEKMSPERVKHYFQRGVGPQAGNYRVKSELRTAVHFGQLNLLGGPPPSPEPFHMIFCRNVMIYFDKTTQEELVQKLGRALVPGGYLFVGHSESLTSIRHSLQSVQPAVYRRPFSHS